jgi:uncharacterized protein with PQ loop repeat
MDTDSLTKIVGWIGAGLTGLSALPQLWNIRVVAPNTYIILTIGLSCLLLRAIYIGEPVFIVSNLVGLVLAIAVWIRWSNL